MMMAIIAEARSETEVGQDNKLHLRLKYIYKK
jgi:hypothetical protein